MNPSRRTGLADVDPLIEVADAEQAELDAAIVVSQAEGVVAAVRQAELVSLQKTAWRRVSAAKGRLTRARRDGNADRIAAAAAAVDAAYAEACVISDEAIRHMQALTAARLQQLGDTMTQMHRAWEAGSAVIEALTNPDTPPNGPG